MNEGAPSMRIIVNHVTRMQHGYICVAGVEPHSGQHVRPTLNGKLRLTDSLLTTHGGPFDMASLVELGAVRPVGEAPEVEDHQFSGVEARAIGVVSPADFWRLLQATARDRLADIFGPDLQQNGATCVVALGKGIASLGCLALASRPRLVIYEGAGAPSPRLQFTDGAFELTAAVTDLRLYERDYTTLRREVIDSLNERFEQGTRVILSVGLTRPWQKPGEPEERHWLQVNNIHVKDQPVWRLGEQLAHAAIPD